MTFAQAKAKVNKALRTARAVYRQADTSGEKVERNLDRLITKRKKIVTPEELLPLFKKYEDWARLVVQFERSLGLTSTTISQYLIK